MRIFEKDYKTNFVDVNNVLLGFDSRQSCCEDFGYLFTRALPALEKVSSSTPNEIENEDVLESFVFDSEFYMEGPESVAFRLTDGSKELFLVLYNHHNGYYSHGFSMTRDGNKTHEGSL